MCSCTSILQTIAHSLSIARGRAWHQLYDFCSTAVFRNLLRLYTVSGNDDAIAHEYRVPSEFCAR